MAQEYLWMPHNQHLQIHQLIKAFSHALTLQTIKTNYKSGSGFA